MKAWLMLRVRGSWMAVFVRATEPQFLAFCAAAMERNAPWRVMALRTHTVVIGHVISVAANLSQRSSHHEVHDDRTTFSSDVQTQRRETRR